MDVKIHVIASVVLAALLYQSYGLWVLLTVIAGVILDIDHNIYFYYKKGHLSLRKCYRYYKYVTKNRKLEEVKNAIFIFHVIELSILFFVLGFFNRIFFLVFYGIALHYILDIIYEMKDMGVIVKPYSLIYWLIKKKE